ncbi:hypothetical protein GCM10027164_33600 [Algoriphagus taiwanensis]|uniref:Uncharacterized protein n=2 Tax=Algoriphagus taiwanensis TaxID=1445656 RepID=A0ABQ6Q011_9BACT|nr:hypothetical protein Ataiwa_18020 [Algoriphagus taiwanensis]
MKYDGLLDQFRFIESFITPNFLNEISKKTLPSENRLIEKIILIEEILIKNDKEYLIWLWKDVDYYFFQDFDSYLVDGIFDDFARLWSWFKHHQLDLLKKYFSLTPEESKAFCTHEDNPNGIDQIYTLSFHLTLGNEAKKWLINAIELWSEDHPIPLRNERSGKIQIELILNLL